MIRRSLRRALVAAVLGAVSLATGAADSASAATFTWSPAVTTHPGATYLACPSSSVCTILTLGNVAYTFDPSAPTTVSRLPFAAELGRSSSFTAVGLSCVAADSCVALNGGGQAITFSPVAGTITGDRATYAGDLFGLTCLSLTRCVVPGIDGYRMFDPTPVDRNVRPFRQFRLPGATYSNVTCASASECVAIAQRDGVASVFSPGRPSTTAYQINRHSSLNDVVCPTARRCVAVNSVGAVISFSPISSKAVTKVVDSDDLNGIVCQSASFCVAADRGGRVVYGRPGQPKWTTKRVPGAHRLQAIASVGNNTYVVVDNLGDAFVGRLAQRRHA